MKDEEIDVTHCRKIGEALGELHQVDFTGLDIADSGPDDMALIDWGYYLGLGRQKCSVWTELLEGAIPRLLAWNARAARAVGLLAAERVISHRDMDPKNVMWSNDFPVIIDWEAAGYVNPRQELLETVVYWSLDKGHVDRKKFMAFMEGYSSRAGRLQADWGVVLDSGFAGKLGWLEYNLKRSLWLECSDEQEQQLGTAEVVDTIGSIIRYGDMVLQLEQFLIGSSVSIRRDAFFAELGGEMLRRAS